MKPNTFFIISFVLGIVALLTAPAGLPPILAIIFAIIGFGDYNTKTQTGKGYGIAGLILGILYFLNYLYQYGYLDDFIY